jgi:ABC-type transporter Mla subunit MlaD
MPKNEDYVIENLDSSQNPSSHVVDELRRSFKPPGAGTPTTPAEKIEDSLAKVQNLIREQQMTTEENLQNSLSKASTNVADSQSIDTLLALSQQISSLVSQGNEALRANSQQLSELITQLSSQVATQQAKADRQIACSLQKAVSALSDAQNAMFQSIALTEMTHLVNSASGVTKDVMAPGEVQ